MYYSRHAAQEKSILVRQVKLVALVAASDIKV
jgi:hypothetical protein